MKMFTHQQMYHLFISLLISSAGAQWVNPQWVEGPPANSPAYGHANLTTILFSTTRVSAEENIRGNSVLAVLRFNQSGPAPVFLGGTNCTNLVKQGTPTNGSIELLSLKELDFESGDPNTGECNFVIYVNPVPQHRTLSYVIFDMNDNTPYFVNPNQTLSFSENALGIVYDFDAVDADAGDTASLTFTLKAVAGDISNFALDRATGVLSVTKKLNFENTQLYLFSVVVTDIGGLWSSVQVSLNVIDQKDTLPVWKHEVPVITINEELPVDEIVFTVEAQDGDIAINDEIIYSLDDPRGSFSIDTNSGYVRIAQKIDRDIENFDPYFDLVIKASCKNFPNFTSNSLSTVLIKDVNDNPPRFDKPVYDFNETDEGYVGRLTQMEIVISDPDLQGAGSYTVKIEGSPVVTQHLQISPQKGRNSGIFSLTVTSANLLDYEDVQKRNVTFTIVATEESGTRTATSVINIFSRDVNDNSPLFTKQIFEARIVENEEVGRLVSIANAIDADISDKYGQPSVRYSFVETFEASPYLKIDERTGEIRTAVKIDRESIGTSLRYTLQAIDKNGDFDGRRTYANLSIEIQDVNDDPPVFKPPSAITFNLQENATTETNITNVFASDRDEIPNLQLSINWYNSKFKKNRAIIDMVPEEWRKTFVLGETSLYSKAGQSNGIVTTTVTNTIKVGDAWLPAGTCTNLDHSPLDRETFDSVDLCLTVTDLNTDSLQPVELAKDETCFVINILDVNDNSPVFDDIEEFFIVDTSNSTEIVFGSVRATDPDFGEIVVYSIKSDDSCSNITINPNSGQLKTTDIIDREVTDTIKCVVTATDKGADYCSSSATITIKVIDINDNPPILTVSINPIEIYECSEKTELNLTTTVISKLQATDADTGSYGIVKYMISEQTFEGLDEFAIDLDKGDMTVMNCALLDFEKKTNFSVVVEARDNYRPGITSGSLFDTERVSIFLKDVNDNPPTLSLPGTGCYASPLESLKLNDNVTSIQGDDKDSKGPNSKMIFTLHEQKRIGEQLDKCKELFRMETDNYSVGRLFVAVPNMLDCRGNYNITIEACDEGDIIFGSQCSGKVTYRICVKDVNNNYPQFVFPVKEGSIVEVPENSPVGDILIYNKTSRLTFKATDDDEELNGQILYTWSNDSYNSIFALDKDTGEVTLAKALNRNIASSYKLVVMATDKGVPNPLRNETELRINVRISNKTLPFFNPTVEQLSFKENSIEEHPFQVSVDKDNEHLYPGESRYDVCYYRVCGNTKYFDVPDKTVNRLRTTRELDRENPPPVPYVIVFTSNDCTNKPPIQPCSEIDTTRPQYLNVSVAISDVNDCSPEFSGSLSGGITEGDSPETIVFPMTVTDQDENESITCQIEEQFTVSDSTLENLIKPPFYIDETHKIKLRFTMQASMKGYFALNVTCTDKESHSTMTAIKIYIVTKDNKVDIIFDNTQAEVEAKRTEIERVFTTTLGYTCNVGNVVPYSKNKADASQYYSSVSHFINQTSNTPVLAGEILTLKSIPAKENELIARCKNEANLILFSVGPLPTEQNTSEAIFRILFIVVSILVIAMILVVVIVFIRNSDLHRRNKALSPAMRDSDFGSQDSEIYQIGSMAPNSNKHTATNPVYNHETESPIHNRIDNSNCEFDNISESSGDSILIGVENNPEFKNYKPNGNANGIIFDSSSSMPYQNIARRNPLLLHDGFRSETEPPTPPLPRTAPPKRPAPQPPVLVLEDENESSFESNSIFSF